MDAFSDDGRYGVTIIGFIGSVFSPYYAEARKTGLAEPLNHCAMNVCLYGKSGHRWAMTERIPGAVARDAASFQVGPSSMTWDGDALTIRIDEVTNPLPTKIKGVVRLYPAALTDYEAVLDGQSLHRWRPLAPTARVEVELQSPGVRWSGDGYLDFNHGDEPLEAGFVRWDWSRAPLKNGAAVLYDVACRGGEQRPLALHIDRNGEVRGMDLPPPAKLPRTLWMIARGTRADAGGRARIVKTLEDTPFYTRSKISARLIGETVTGMHESLCLDRFRSAWVQKLLPYRMPRK